jgi:D-amino peptidase
MLRTTRNALTALSFAALSLAPRAGITAQRPLRVYISVDMEGIAGVVTGDQLGPGGFEYQKAREWMTGEVNAAIRGARDAGATEFVISDSHGNGESLLIDQLPADVRIVRSWPRPLMMMEGIDSSFAVAFFIGYHASTTNIRGVRAHTISSAHLAAVSLDGIMMPEAGINAAIAGRFGVPVALITGDDAIIDEARKVIGPMEGAVVKRAISFHAAETMTPQMSQQTIQAAAKRAFERRASFKPYTVKTPVELDLTFKNYRAAEMLTFLPYVTRVNAHTVHFTGKDILEVSRFLEFVNTYETDLSP